LSYEDWVARRLVASKLRDRRVFICGDAAHVWMPLGGFGMSAGIADAANLAWKLAGVLHGWATPEILDAYEAERQPITDQASRIISDIGHQVMIQRHELSPDIEQLDAIGEGARTAAGQLAYALDVEQQCCGGLNFGYFYDRSPIIAYDGEQAPTYTMGTFTSTTVPGYRTCGSKGGALSTTRWDRIMRCCASTPRRASPASSRRPRSAAFRSPFST
jgi:hypothetical protein